MWIIKVSQPCSQLSRFFWIFAPQSNFSIWSPNKINCIGLSNDFATKSFRSFVESRVKTGNPPSKFVVEGFMNRENWKDFIKLLS